MPVRKRGRRERKARKARELAEKALVLQARAKSKAGTLKTPSRELSLLTLGRTRGAFEAMQMTPENIASRVHTQNLYLGRSPGSGKPERKVMPARFKTQFLAETVSPSLKTTKADIRIMVRTGTTPAHMAPVKDKETGEVRVVRVKSKPRFAEIGRSSSVPKHGCK